MAEGKEGHRGQPLSQFLSMVHCVCDGRDLKLSPHRALSSEGHKEIDNTRLEEFIAVTLVEKGQLAGSGLEDNTVLSAWGWAAMTHQDCMDGWLGSNSR